MLEILFYILGAAAIISAVLVITLKNPFFCALFLLTHFISLAVLYILLSAPLVAIFQVSIYAGAILVLIVFVIMLLDPDQFQDKRRYVFSKIGGGFLAGILLLFLAGAALQAKQGDAPGLRSAEFGLPGTIGDLLVGDYILHFEVASVLLLLALIGAIYLSKRKL